MTTAGDILKDTLQKMGADAWCDGINIVNFDAVGAGSVVSGGIINSRPAWQDGDGWFVLPDWWEWDPRNKRFRNNRCSIQPVPRNGAVYFWSDTPKNCIEHDYAPDAFRAAQQWIDSTERTELQRNGDAEWLK